MRMRPGRLEAQGSGFHREARMTGAGQAPVSRYLIAKG